jgi:ABC-type antimicrobial peptide transport system permease subunit
MTIVLRTAGDPLAILPSVRAIVRDVDPAVALQAPRPLADLVGEMTASRRLNTMLLVVFAAVAALLAAVGVYGVMSYAVEQRTRELGVRRALGASLPNLVGLVMGEGLGLSAVGLVLGLGAALALGSAMTRLLYEIPATDPVTLGAIALVTAAVVTLACAVPAVRATRIDPVTALRVDE